MNDDIKDLIKIPDGLDNAILKGLEDGKKKNKYDKRVNILKRFTIAASVAIVLITVIGVVNPQIVSAIPIVNKVFEYFDNSKFGYALDKYEELGEVINKTIDKDGTKITLDQIVVDDNIFMASITVESENLKGYAEDKNQGDFFNPDFYLKINGHRANQMHSTVEIINESKGVAILYADVSDIKLKDKLKIDLDIRDITRGIEVIANGSWKYNINTTKGINSESYDGDNKIAVDGGEVWLDSLVKTPLTNRLFIKGKYETGTNESHKLDDLDYRIRDNNGNVLNSEVISGHSDGKGHYERVINIMNDLSNVEFIEVIPTQRSEEIRKEIDGIERPVLICAVNSVDEVVREEEIVSRKPTERELNDGYALDNVQYCLNIDKNKSFMTIDELAGKDINVNSSDSVTIISIEANEKSTKVNMKIDGLYNYNNLTSLVIFDEDRNDIGIWEDHRGAIMENPETNECSITFGPIDKNKKYTIGIPMVEETVYDEQNKITVKLK